MSDDYKTEHTTPDGQRFNTYKRAEPSAEKIAQRIAQLSDPAWKPTYSYWRHGGSYVDNLQGPGGSGCIASAAKTISGKFEIACDPRVDSWGAEGSKYTYRTRDAAAYAERDLVLAQWRYLAEQAA